MAQQAEVTTFDGDKTIDLILQLIRYDIPALVVGKSSVGKSYTLIDVTEKWHLSNAILYIGSEKSENIEGIPKLTDRPDPNKEILEYLQPYWFPNGAVITHSVKNGYSLYKKFIKSYWDVNKYTPSYRNLHSILNALSYLKYNIADMDASGVYKKEFILIDQDASPLIKLNSKPFELVKFPQQKIVKKGVNSDAQIPDEYYRDDLKDFCSFLTTALGYGNYWLILDEMDKVDQWNTDKFAPLLHIVRERTLKNFSMKEINNGKGLDIPFSVNSSNSGYAGVIDKIAKDLEANESVLDTRVMGVANETKELEKNADALFRRFVQVIVEEVMIWRKSDIGQATEKIVNCVTKVKNEQIASPDGFNFTDLIAENKIARIAEINLQWKYNFLPKLVNEDDKLNNYFYIDLFDEESKWGDKPNSWKDEQKFTALYKILADNYTKDVVDTPQLLFDCLGALYLGGEANAGENVMAKEEMLEGKRKTLADNLQALTAEETALDIVSKISDAYVDVLTEEESSTRLIKATNWVTQIVDWLHSSLYDNDGEFAPLGDVYKYLIPKLTETYYSSILFDDSDANQMDSIYAITHKFQTFFVKLMNDKPEDFEFQLDVPSCKNLISQKEDYSIEISKKATQQYEDVTLNILYENFQALKGESVAYEIQKNKYGIKEWVNEHNREWLDSQILKYQSEGKKLNNKTFTGIANLLKITFGEK